ncbi:uncharacterized protein LOC143301040 [Babylonia areolata]|uniref:uncharacterized protein LOC143301040 n=1 Tax=Babylonia areolata TaxID=304850 RepID=UPI003FD0AB90
MRAIHAIVKIAIFIPVTVLQGCSDITSRPCCRQASSVQFPDSVLHPAGHGSCVFNNTLCSYTQGCADTSMSHWTPHDGYAFAFQKRNDFSEDETVLVSPLLDFNQDSCFQASYSIEGSSNADMDGFLEYNNSNHDVFQLIERVGVWVSSERIRHTIVTIRKNWNITFGRVKIRAKAGGASKEVRLFSVLLSEGRCEDPSCDFSTDLCEWVASGWETVPSLGTAAAFVTDADHLPSGGFANLRDGTGTGTGKLTSPLTRATGSLGGCVCVRFRYVLWTAGSLLSVSLVLADGSSSVLWNVQARTMSSRRWKDGVFPVRVSKAYRIVFSGQRSTSPSSIVAVDSVQVTSNSSLSACRFEPPEAAVGGNAQNTAPPTPATLPTSSNVLSTSSVATSSTLLSHLLSTEASNFAVHLFYASLYSRDH